MGAILRQVVNHQLKGAVAGILLVYVEGGYILEIQGRYILDIQASMLDILSTICAQPIIDQRLLIDIKTVCVFAV